MGPDGIRCLVHPPASGVRNMAVDEALMEGARSHGGVTLRFYRWDPPCLSLGRNQPARARYDVAGAKARGIDIVRRPTGGRAVYHHRELTYSVTAPGDLWGGLRRSYRRVNRALLRGLRRLGAAVGEAARDEGEASPGPSVRACFRDPLPGEIVAYGRKLVGSAQWREEGALLQHGSLLLVDDQRVASELRLDRGGAREGGGPRRRDEGAGGVSLAELLPRLPHFERLVGLLRDGFREEFGMTVRGGGLTRGEEEIASELADRYESDSWTWRH